MFTKFEDYCGGDICTNRFIFFLEVIWEVLIALVFLHLKLNALFRFFPKSRAEVEASFRRIGIDSLLGWTSSQGKSRVDEIYYWMKNFDNKTIQEDVTIKKWIAIDDMNLLKLDEKRMKDHFVLTAVTQGITEETVNEAIMLLS